MAPNVQSVGHSADLTEDESVSLCTCRDGVLHSSTAVLSPVAVLACISYAVSSTLITLLNKVVFSHSRFHYPWTTLAVQNILSVVLISAGHIVGMTQSGRYSRKLGRDMSVPILCFVLFIFTNAQSMRHINIPVLTVWKSLGPMFVTLFERFYFGDRFSVEVYLAMGLIVLSALVTAINDLEYSAVGYFWAAANVFANVAYLASLRIYLRSPNVSALDKTFHSNLLSLIPIFILAFLSDETQYVVRDFQTTSHLFKFVFVVSGFLTTAVCATAFWTISLTNGSTLSFIGGMNKVPMILISLLVFETHMSWAGWAGVGLGILAGWVFMRAKSVASTQSKALPVKAVCGTHPVTSNMSVGEHSTIDPQKPLLKSSTLTSVTTTPTVTQTAHAPTKWSTKFSATQSILGLIAFTFRRSNSSGE